MKTLKEIKGDYTALNDHLIVCIKKLCLEITKITGEPNIDLTEYDKEIKYDINSEDETYIEHIIHDDPIEVEIWFNCERVQTLAVPSFTFDQKFAIVKALFAVLEIVKAKDKNREKIVVGQRYTNHGDEYILALANINPDYNSSYPHGVCLINLSNGNRFTDVVYVMSAYDITNTEFKKITVDGIFERVINPNK